MSRKIKHAIGWGILGAVIAAFFVSAAILQGVTFTLYFIGGIILLGAIGVVIVLLINS